MKSGLLISVLVVALQGCGGGNSGNKINPPPPPQFIGIDAPGAGMTAFLGTTAQDIDANGDIAGFYTDPNNTSHGFVRSSAGTLTVFNAPGAGSANSEGTDSQGINTSATIVGSFLDQQLVSYSRTSSGVFTTLDVPGSSATLARGINDGGGVTG